MTTDSQNKKQDPNESTTIQTNDLSKRNYITNKQTKQSYKQT